jgi:predicted small secreted protein
MLKLRRFAGTALVMGVLLVALTGCEKGPAQKAGEDIDEAVEKVGEAIEEAGEDVREAASDTRD